MEPKNATHRTASAMQLSSKFEPSCAFGLFACLSWHLADRVGGKIGLVTAMTFLRRHRRGTLCYDLVAVSAAVAPVATL